LNTLWRRRLPDGRVWSFFFLLLVAGASHGCVTGHALVARDTAELDAPGVPPQIGWFTPAAADDGTSLARWRMSVGPPVFLQPAPTDARPHDAITIVSWNTAVGAADIVGFVQTLPNPRGPLVLLLQEVYREGPEVPAHLAPGFAFAGRLRGATGGQAFREIKDVARTLGLAVYYVPSMRNGGPASDEDRGNAILSNLPLADLHAMELPFERQRRVAIAATVAGRTDAGAPWRVRLVSAHLDNLGGIRRAWIGAEYGRARQARGLTALLHDSEPTILAGDFNTWFGFSDQAYIETARAFPETHIDDRRATFHGLLRLDHVFLRLAPGWRAEFHRASSRFGSDHYPLVGTLRFN
jgi:endonuclease/exonuclease/phosphatase family metal-dependent hydrolase